MMCTSRMRIYLLSALFHTILLSTTSGCIQSPYGDGCLVADFSDEFDTFNMSKWTHEVTMSGNTNREFELYVPDAANSFVQDGVFHIHPTFTADWFQESMCTNYSDPPVDWTYGCELSFDAQPTKTIYGTNISYPGVYPGQCSDDTEDGCERRATGVSVLNPVVSGRLHSNYSFLYGRVEVRAKLPVGNWLWPAIWMFPEKSVYGEWPRSGEIDIMESRGNDPSYKGDGYNYFGSTLHWGPKLDEDEYIFTHTLDMNNTLTTEWHIYGVKWTSTGIYTYLDNDTNRVLNVNTSVPLWDQFHLDGPNPWAGAGINAPFDQPFHMMLNLAVGGTNGYFPDSDWVNGGASLFWANKGKWQPTWTQPDLLIDYVHVYQ